jgi:hypothetical protein
MSVWVDRTLTKSAGFQEKLFNKEGIQESRESSFLAHTEKLYLLYVEGDPWQIPKVKHQEDTRNHADPYLRYTFFVLKVPWKVGKFMVENSKNK